METTNYKELFKLSKDVKDFVMLVRKAKNKKKEATIKRYYYKVRAEVRNKKKVKIPVEYNFEEYSSSRMKILKLLDFKRMKIKITERLLIGEGFTYDEINKILGRTELKKIETFEEEVYV